MMTFPDVGKSYLYKINGDQGILMTEGVDESAAVQVKMDSTIFIKMLTKQINPIKAYSSGSLEVKGEMKNMLKLRGLMF
jgi:putative sterol carrier protein